MSLVVFQHEANEPAALLGQVLQGYGHRLRTVELFNGAAVPADLDDVDGVISMGGSMNVDETAKYAWLPAEMDFIKKAHGAGLPIVGVCLGAQLIAQALGGAVAAMEKPEVGWQNVKQAFPGTVDPIYAGIPWDTMQFHMHGQQVTTLPPDSTPLAGSKACRTQAFRVGLRVYAFQYHFEWGRTQIEKMAGDPLVAKAGATAADITGGIEKHYTGYRRVGERLCERLALMVFPVDKRRTA